MPKWNVFLDDDDQFMEDDDYQKVQRITRKQQFRDELPQNAVKSKKPKNTKNKDVK